MTITLAVPDDAILHGLSPLNIVVDRRTAS
jgi:hypothetical protein